MVETTLEWNNLRKAGIRPTAVRIAILQTLRDTESHPSAEQLIKRLNRTAPNFGRATVYQNLDRLVDAGLVHELVDDGGVQRYDGNTEAHEHLVCVETGEIIDVAVDPALLKAMRPLDPVTGKPIKNWRVDDVKVVFRARRA